MTTLATEDGRHAAKVRRGLALMASWEHEHRYGKVSCRNATPLQVARRHHMTLNLSAVCDRCARVAS